MTKHNRAQQQPIAVVGAGALIPGATGTAGFWRTVVAGDDQVTGVPPGHWLIEDYYDPDPSTPDKTYGRRGAFLPPVEFDPLAYGIPPNTLPATDTTQLLSLLVADQVLKDVSRGNPDALDRERVSVILGTAPLDLLATMANRLQRPVWLKSLRENGIEEAQAQAICDRIADHYVPWQEASFPGLLSNVVAGRIANRFDLHGTNCTTDAACASSLAAVSHAMSELALGNADMVLTGGVDTLNDIVMYMCFSKTPALSATGDCRPFSDRADGTVLGEGLVMVALKRLADAERDGDPIYAVIKGIGTSSDGRSTAIYAPLPEGQARALRRAYEAAGYGPETVGLVEAHGTGTKAGDLAEFTALSEVFGESSRTGEPWCALGSIKSQIGHTKSAAGAAGLLKAVLAVHHKVLPPTIKVDRPNPGFDLASGPLYVNTEARPWIAAPGEPRRASVSSFGFGGSNFHLTLEEYVPAGNNAAADRMRTAASELVLLSADSPAELTAQAHGLSVHDGLSTVARRSQDEFRNEAHARLAVVATDAADLTAKLERAAEAIGKAPEIAFSFPAGISYASGTPEPGEVAFLFPGQGSQYVGMGAGLAMEFDAARQAWDTAAGVDLGDRTLDAVVFPRPVFSEEEREAQEATLTRTEWAQPALAVQSVAQLKMLAALGISPDRLGGHSFGELVALHVAGAYDENTLIRLARKRGELMSEAAASVAGVMLAVKATREDVEGVLAEVACPLWIANHNAPEQVVVSGSEEAVAQAERAFRDRRIAAKRLNAATAFHSPLVAAASKPLLGFLNREAIAAPQIPVYSNADVGVYPGSPDVVRARIAEHLGRPVRFAEQIETMYADGARTFVEVGAGATLTGLVGQILGDRPHLAVSLDRKGRHGVTSLHEALGRLAVSGLAIDFAGLWAGFPLEKETSVPSKPKMTTTLTGTNYGKPYPPAAGAAGLPAPVTSAPAAPVQDEWLRAFQETQRQTAEAHAEYQRVMAESHLAYLRLTESSLTGLTPGAPLPSPVLTPAPEMMPLPPAYPEPVHNDHVLPPAVDVESVLLAVVGEKTGYPVEMLDAGMELEGDLGIDSIKRVEILSGLRERVPGLPEVNAGELGKLRTLGEIVGKLRDIGSSAPTPEPEPEIDEVPLSRTVPAAVAAPASGQPLPGLGARLLMVTDDGTGVAPLVAARLAECGIDAIVVDEVPADAGSVLFLGGLARASAPEEAIAVNHAAFRAARAFAPTANEHGGVFVTVQDTGGDFGLGGSERAWLGGLAALTRTAAREWPRATTKAIDLERGDRTPEEIAEALVAELLEGGTTAEVGLPADGSRITLKDAPTPAGTGAHEIGP
ncbi:MAG TPA: beta-ketoacyl synthase N-terminal-like domain-containing protein, partial [Amycolatopsis sp.]|nr:beta-ketoacyl synthase N-terminal-like domain-containing protein [Amycolatopsis sp.]